MKTKSKHVGAGRAVKVWTAWAWRWNADGEICLSSIGCHDWAKGYAEKHLVKGRLIQIRIHELPKSRKGRNSNRNRLDKSRR